LRTPFQGPFPNCKSYESLTTCAQCETGVLSLDRQSCNTEFEILGCSVYDNSMGFLRCSKCLSDWYLHFTGQCLKRSLKTIGNCLALDDLVDGCFKCRAGYMATTDFTQCLPIVPNCQSYDPSSAENTSLVCRKCAAGFFLNLNKNACEIGTVAFCEVLSATSNTCLKCNQGFTLKTPTLCVRLAQVDNCAVPSQNGRGDCDVCPLQMLHYWIANKCISFRPIQFCLTHDSDGDCGVCNEGYRLVETACQKIVWPNCAKFDEVGCEVCSPGFVMDSESSACLPLASSKLNNCVPDTIFGIKKDDQTVGCRECVPETSPIQLRDNLVCLPILETPNIDPQANPEFCARHFYDSDTGTYQCLECAKGTVMTDLGCLPGCPDPQQVIVTHSVANVDFETLQFTKNHPPKRNKCTGNSASACLEYSPYYFDGPSFFQSQSQTPQSSFETEFYYICSKCKPDTLPIVFLNDLSVVRPSIDQTTFSPAVESLTQFSALPGIDTCLPKDSPAYILGNPDYTIVDGCVSYTMFQLFDKQAVGCQQCSFGKTGVVRTPFSNCDSYDTDIGVCERCKQGHYLDKHKLGCLPIPPNSIPHCLQYEEDTQHISCHLCDLPESYMVEGEEAGGQKQPNNCLPRTYKSAHCEYNIHGDNCISCISEQDVQYIAVDHKCFPGINNCEAHRLIEGPPFYECSVCLPSFYLSDTTPKTCVEGTKTNCLKLDFATDNCLECPFEYTLSNGSCFETSELSVDEPGHCAENSSGTCLTCLANYFKFEVKSLCAANPIQNCLVMKTLDSCKTCVPGHYLKTPDTCAQIDPQTHCLDYAVLDLNGDGDITADDLVEGLFELKCVSCNDGFWVQDVFNEITFNDQQIVINNAHCLPFPDPPEVERRLTSSAGPATSQSIASLYGQVPGCESWFNPFTDYHILNVPSCLSCSPDSIAYSLQDKGSCVLKAPFQSHLTEVQNCLFYSYDRFEKRYVCKGCAAGFGLLESGGVASCIDSKKTETILVPFTLTLDVTKRVVKLGSRNVYIPRGSNNLPGSCVVASPPYVLDHSTQSIKYSCIKCDTGFEPIFSIDPTSTSAWSERDLFSSFSHTTSLDDSSSDIVIGRAYPTIRDCVGTAAFAALTLGGEPVEDCAFWGKTGTKYACLACATGYLSKVTWNEEVSQSHISECGAMPVDNASFMSSISWGTFEIESSLLGTVGSLGLLFPNNRCFGSAKVVFAFVQLAKIGVEPTKVLGWSNYGPVSAITNSVKTLLGAFHEIGNDQPQHTHVCLEANQIAADPRFTTAQSQMVVNNCALYLVDTLEDLSPSGSGSSRKGLYCVACLPGFSGTINSQSGLMAYVISCTAVTASNVSSPSRLINTYSDCAFGSKADPVNGLRVMDFSKCSGEIDNCLILNSETNPAKCEVCRQGYSLTFDGSQCNQLIDGDFFYLGNNYLKRFGSASAPDWFPLRSDGAIAHLAWMFFEGFVSCSPDKHLIYPAGRPTPFLFKQYCIPDTPAQSYVDKLNSDYAKRENCELFGWADVQGMTSVGCQKCSTGFALLLQSNGAKDRCVDTQNALDNCLLAYQPTTDQLKCHTCDQEFISLNGNCEEVEMLQTELHCAQLDTAEVMRTSIVPICLECKIGYKMIDGLCFSTGTLDTCAVFADGECAECKSGYLFSEEEGKENECVKDESSQPSDVNCLRFETGEIRSGRVLQTAECSPDEVSINGVCILADVLRNCDVVQNRACSKCNKGSVLHGGPSPQDKRCFEVGTATQPTEHDSHCLSLDSDNFMNGKLVCAECVEGFFPQPASDDPPRHVCYEVKQWSSVPNCSSFSSTIDSLSTSITNSCSACSGIYSFLHISDGVCQPRPEPSFDPQHCLRFSDDSSFCTDCVPGRSPPNCDPIEPIIQDPITPIGPQSKIRTFHSEYAFGYIESCTTSIPGCDASTFFHGLMSREALLFSCHKCQNDDDIPYAFVRTEVVSGGSTSSPFSDVYGWGSYLFDPSETDLPPGNFEGGLANVCASLTHRFHPEYVAFESTDLPNGCGLAMIRVLGSFESTSTNKTNGDPNTLSVFCSACKPGYKKTLMSFEGEGRFRYVVSSCSEIANCAKSSTFNYCDVCKSGYVFKGRTAKDVQFDSCVAFDDKNCLAISEDTEECILCKKGYFLNLDLVCEKLVLQNCKNEEDNFFMPDPTGFNMYLVMNMLSAPGCNSGCETGYFAASSSQSTVFCVESAYSQDPYSPSTKIEKNCKTFKADFAENGRVVCQTCLVGFTLLLEKQSCVKHSDPKCIVGSVSGGCLTCQEGNHIVKGVCASKTIQRCEAYKAGAKQLTCEKCAQEHVLKANKCILGSIKNCAEYDKSERCVACLPRHFLTVNSDFKTVCILIEQLNCLEFSPDSFNHFRIECLTCVAGFKLAELSEEDQSNKCLDFGVNQNCQKYSVDDRVDKSSFRCSECAAGHFYSSDLDKCSPRSLANSQDCLILDPLNDDCLVKREVATPPDSPSPIEPMDIQPTGVSHCATYNTDLECSRCLPTHYLKNKECLWMHPETQVDNCDGYDEFGNCFSCEEGFQLKEGRCENESSSVCQILHPFFRNCIKCKQGYELVTTNFDSECVALNVQNCIMYSESYPFVCLLCGEDKVVGDNGNCVPLTKKVPFCSTYTSDGLCKECLSGFTLRLTADSDGTKVVSTTCSNTSEDPLFSQLDDQCDVYEYKKQGFCTVCKSGYYLSDSKCYSCEAGEGCAICDYRIPSKCIACMSTHYQNERGECVSLSIEETIANKIQPSENFSRADLSEFGGSF
jgi:hypothetical protein